MVPLFEVLWAFGLVFVSCELAEKMSNEYEEIGELIEQFDYYSFPFDFVKMLPLIMLNGQQPVYFECFGSIACSRETFKKVIEIIQFFEIVKLHFS